MGFEELISGVLIAVLGGLILDIIRDMINKAKKTPSWIKDLFRFAIFLISCIFSSAYAAIAYNNNAASFALILCVVIISSSGLFLLFYSYRRAFESVYNLSQKVLDRWGDEISKNGSNKNS